MFLGARLGKGTVMSKQVRVYLGMGCAALVCTAAAVAQESASINGIRPVQPTPVVPTHVARVYADGSRGAWRVYRPGPGGATTGFFAIWDSLETDPANWNTRDLRACEYYPVPRDSDPATYCFGKCSGQRIFPGFKSALYATGGDVRTGFEGETATVMSFLWRVNNERRDPVPLELMIVIYDDYDGNECSDPGSNLVSGVVLRFNPPDDGFYRTTIDLVGNGVELETPTDGTFGLQMLMYKDQQKREIHPGAGAVLWMAKSEWPDAMGRQHANGFSDHVNPNGKLEADDCYSGVRLECGEDALSPVIILLGGATSGNCGAMDPCDTNCDGSVDLIDVEPFIALLLGGGEQCVPGCSGDTNRDGSIDLSDVASFIACLF